MAFGAGHIPMAGGSPGVHIRIHLMTEATESGRLGKSEQYCGHNKKGDNRENQEDLYPFQMDLGPPLSRFVEIGAKIPDQLVRIFEGLRLP
jgi:hypothetical protein